MPITPKKPVEDLTKQAMGITQEEARGRKKVIRQGNAFSDSLSGIASIMPVASAAGALSRGAIAHAVKEYGPPKEPVARPKIVTGGNTGERTIRPENIPANGTSGILSMFGSGGSAGRAGIARSYSQPSMDPNAPKTLVPQKRIPGFASDKERADIGKFLTDVNEPGSTVSKKAAAKLPAPVLNENLGNGIWKTVDAGGNVLFSNAAGRASNPIDSQGHMGKKGLTPGELSSYGFGGMDLTNLSPTERSQAKVDYLNSITDQLRAARQPKGRGLPSTQQDFSVTPGQRQDLLKNFKKELADIMYDSKRGKLTVGGAQNAIDGLKAYYGEALGLTPQEEESGKTLRQDMGNRAGIEQTQIAYQNKDQNKGTKTSAEYKPQKMQLSPGMEIVTGFDPASGTITYPDWLNSALKEFKANVQTLGEDKAVEAFKKKYPDIDTDPRQL